MKQQKAQLTKDFLALAEGTALAEGMQKFCQKLGSKSETRGKKEVEAKTTE